MLLKDFWLVSAMVATIAVEVSNCAAASEQSKKPFLISFRVAAIPADARTPCSSLMPSRLFLLDSSLCFPVSSDLSPNFSTSSEALRAASAASSRFFSVSVVFSDRTPVEFAACPVAFS